jgi:hypothetical protein
VELARAFCAALVSFQPEVCSGEDCAVLVEELAAVEKVSAAARVRAAAHAGSCGAHRQPLCLPDHRIKTEHDRKAGLLHRKKPRDRQPVRAGPEP